MSECLFLDDVLARLGMSRRTAYRWMAEGRFPFAEIQPRLGGRPRYRAADVDRYLRGEQWRALVTTAAQRAQLSHKALAADLGISESHLSGQLAGAPNQHLSLWRMRGLPRSFWQEFVLLLIEFYDLSVGASAQTQRYAEIGRRVCETHGLVEVVRRA
jgi:predicted DNA-binding transcriptional regulator AlpA